jgi:hypothetical protein
MSGSADELRIEVIGDEIVVILPATSYGVTYYKPANSPHLLTKDLLSKNDSRAPMTLCGVLAPAWKAASAKARELGWIV